MQLRSLLQDQNGFPNRAQSIEEGLVAQLHRLATPLWPFALTSDRAMSEATARKEGHSISLIWECLVFEQKTYKRTKTPGTDTRQVPIEDVPVTVTILPCV